MAVRHYFDPTSDLYHGGFQCLETCLRMMLEYRNITATQEAICWRTKPDRDFGTPPINGIQACHALGAHAEQFTGTSEAEAIAFLKEQSPCIAFLNAGVLHGSAPLEYGHAVVVLPPEEDRVLFHDPCRKTGGSRQRTETGRFLKAWVAYAPSNNVEPQDSVDVQYRYIGMVVK